MLAKPFSRLRLVGRPTLATVGIAAGLSISLSMIYLLASKHAYNFPATSLTTTARENKQALHELLSVYDPLRNANLTAERMEHKCITYLPKRNEIEELRDRGWDPSRYLAYFNVDKLLSERFGNLDASMPLSEKPRVLDAGGSAFLKSYLNVINRTQTRYPGTDLHGTSFPDNSFDVIAADQLIEHTNFPQLVMLEVHRILKKGGWAIVTTCATNPVHDVKGGYRDFWRFQLDGLRSLSMPFAGGIKMCGSWGTVKTLSERLHSGMKSINKEGKREEMEEEFMKNDEKNPLLVWIVVEK